MWSSRTALLLSTLLFSSEAALNLGACSLDIAPLLDALFSSLGQDCDTYVSLFSQGAKYYHQHDGYKSYAELHDTCTGYGGFCPGDACHFRQNGDALIEGFKALDATRCYMLVPYIWSEIPPDAKLPGNLEPHTGWEYIIATPDVGAKYGYRMDYFAEIETSYSVAYNWMTPSDTPAVVAESTLALLRLPNSASKGECDNPIAPFVTTTFAQGGWGRQQGDAVVLAAGGVCHVAVPYAAFKNNQLESGYYVFQLKPSGASYIREQSVGFQLGNAVRYSWGRELQV